MPKKTKAIKKTDRKKAWLKKVKPSAYDVEVKEVNQTILIVSEGQTEKLYFKSFPVLTLTVQAVDLGGQSKQKLIDATDSIIKNSNKDYDQVWCVFDMDIKQGAKEYADFDNAIISGQQKKYRIAYSNDSFELWFYLHYQFTEQKHLRQFYYKALGSFWNLNYEKEGKAYDFANQIYDILESDEKASQEDAVTRAKRLFKANANLPFHQQNPVTKVYELVKVLIKNCRR